MKGVAVAASSRMAADAGMDVAAAGGNAVDVAVAAAVASLATETAVASLGGGGFVTVSEPEGDAVTLDGYVEMPGRGVSADRLGAGAREVWMDYGGGVSTVIGPGSVATPGTLAALEKAWEGAGRITWKELLEPSRKLAAEGFPLTPSAGHYLRSSHEVVFGWHPETRRILHGDDGSRLQAGERVVNPGLARSLELLGREGAAALYHGELGRRIADHVLELGGFLSMEDLEAYRPVERTCLAVELDGWTVRTNPPPAIGGAVLAAMLVLMGSHPEEVWSARELERLCRVQEAVRRYRTSELDPSEDLLRDVAGLLDSGTLDRLRGVIESGSTVHVSAVDSEGRACSISASTGYGSGVVAPGTGIFLNNCLGEKELNPRGILSWPVGARLPSNMAPSVARGSDGSVMAIGSPGAGRITTALQQALLNHVRLGMSLEEAVAHPRVHVELDGDATRVAHEPGLDLDSVGFELRPFAERSMYFGGVTAALWHPDRGFEVAADPRREGGVGIHLD